MISTPTLHVKIDVPRLSGCLTASGSGYIYTLRRSLYIVEDIFSDLRELEDSRHAGVAKYGESKIEFQASNLTGAPLLDLIFLFLSTLPVAA